MAFTNFNPLPSREGRHLQDCAQIYWILISIHSPHARGDYDGFSSATESWNFNPLPSREGRQHKPPKILLDSRQFIQQNHHSSFF